MSRLSRQSVFDVWRGDLSAALSGERRPWNSDIRLVLFPCKSLREDKLKGQWALWEIQPTVETLLRDFHFGGLKNKDKWVVLCFLKQFYMFFIERMNVLNILPWSNSFPSPYLFVSFI